MLLSKLAWLANQLPGMPLTLAQPATLQCWIVRGTVLDFLRRFWDQTLMPAK